MGSSSRLRIAVAAAGLLCGCVDLSLPVDTDASQGVGNDAAVRDETKAYLLVNLRRDQFALDVTKDTVFPRYPFPLVVRDAILRTTVNGGRVVDASGSNLRFRGAGEAVCGTLEPCDLPFEIDQYDPVTGRLLAWLRLPQLGLSPTLTGGAIQIYFGAAGLSEDARETWKDMKRVWHLSETADTAATVDSTGTGAGCPSHGIASHSRVETPVGRGVAFDNSDDRFECEGRDGNDKELSIQVFFKHHDPANGIQDRLISRAIGADTRGAQFHYSMDVESSKLVARLHTQSGSIELMSLPGAIVSNIWTLGTLTYDGSVARLFINGVEVENSPLTGRTLSSDDTPLWIGAQPEQGRHLDGTIDEIRLGPTGLDSARIALDALVWQSPESYVSVQSLMFEQL